jgi:hypothetical protein
MKKIEFTSRKPQIIYDREEIQRLTKKFLEQGGIIEEIPFGVSGIKTKSDKDGHDEFTSKADKARSSASKKNKRS